jgi:His-Xaa-Ser system protein HxsD
MEKFLKTIVDWEKFELLIDTKIFSKDIILKTAFWFLDKWYFFFKLDNDSNILLHYTKKSWVEENPEKIIWDYYDSLLEMYLRDKLEKDNLNIREAIVLKAINWPLDFNNFVTLDTDNITKNTEKNQIDFDKDIDDILREIENDPDLKIDEEEISRILREIESEEKSESKLPNPNIGINIQWIKDAKQRFKA